MGRQSFLTIISIITVIAMLFVNSFPSRIVDAGTTWHEGPNNFTNGTMKNLFLTTGGLSIGKLNTSMLNNWTQLQEGNPPRREAFAMAYDDIHDLVVLFGGVTEPRYGCMNDTWIYNSSSNKWTNMNPLISPPARRDHAMVFDSASGEIIMFGGSGHEYIPNDTWTYNISLNLWINRTPTVSPPYRDNHAMVFDSAHNEVVLFGGYGRGYLDDTWTYNSSTNAWINRTPSKSPSARWKHAMAYDCAHEKIIMFGGFAGGSNDLRDTWTYNIDNNTWIEMYPLYPPGGREWHQLAYDSIHGEIVLFGGIIEPYGQDNYNDTWTYNLTTNDWNQKWPSPSPPGRICFGMVYDSYFGEMILFGGGANIYGLIDDTWSYNLGMNTWNNKTSLSMPSSRNSHAMAYDCMRDKIVLFGGYDGTFKNDTWTYDLNTNNWTNQNLLVAPSCRASPAIAYDSFYDEVVLFGGYVHPGFYIYFCDTWTYNLKTNIWTNRNPVISPSKRSSPAMTYNSIHGELILFGGDNGRPLNDTWSYNFTTNNWTNMKPLAAPPARYGPVMAYDGTHDKIVLFGGNGSYPFLNDTWTYDLNTNNWTNMNPDTTPSARGYHAMVYDSGRCEVVLFGGNNPINLCDTWTYNFTTNNWLNANPLIKPPARHNHAMSYSSVHREILLFGGIGDNSSLSDTWAYSHGNYLAAGNYTSSPIDSGGAAYFGTISWDANVPQNTTLGFQIRSADTKENLSKLNYLGSDGTANSFYNVNGQSINSVNNGTRWFQYQAHLGTKDLEITPVLRSVTVRCNLIHNINLLSPNGGENWTGPQNITWTASDKDNDSLAFDLYLENESVKIPLAKDLINDTRKWSWDTDTIPNGTYWVHITVRDDNPSIPLSIDAISGNFTIHHPGPPPPPNHLPHVTLISPQDKSFRATNTAHLLWLGTDPDNDPLTYTVNYSDRPFSHGAIATRTTTSEFLDLNNLSDNTTYYWTVDASDGKSNGTDIPTEVWSFTVRFPPANIPVRFTSTPDTTAWVGQEYSCNFTSIDEDGDIPIFSIVSAPATMTLNRSTAKLRWTPTKSDIGNHTISVRVSDGRGSTDNQTFTITVQEIPTPPVVLPKCVITYPANDAKINGTIQVIGTATNGSLPLSVIKVRIDNGTWTTAVGLSNWSFSLDTAKLAKGPHHIEARAFAAELSSETASVDIDVNNPGPSVSSGGSQWCLAAIAVAFIAGIAVLIIIRKRVNR